MHETTSDNRVIWPFQVDVVVVHDLLCEGRNQVWDEKFLEVLLIVLPSVAGGDGGDGEKTENDHSDRAVHRELLGNDNIFLLRYALEKTSSHLKILLNCAVKEQTVSLK